mgnify:CR=1 FL=1
MRRIVYALSALSALVVVVLYFPIRFWLTPTAAVTVPRTDDDDPGVDVDDFPAGAP